MSEIFIVTIGTPGPPGAQGVQGIQGATGPQGPQGVPGDVISVAGKTGAVVLVKGDVGLANVDDTSDTAKPVSAAQQTALNLKEDSANKGVANGYASLDAGAKIPISQIPDTVVGQMEYIGTWNASTNTPAIPPAATANKGNYYKVSVAGATNIDGITDWKVGDWIISNGTTWDKIDNTESVTSVAGKTGAVILVKGDVGLPNVDDTPDTAKPVSAAQQTALNLKEDSANKGVANGYASLNASAQVVEKSLEFKLWRLAEQHDPLTSIPFREANDALKLVGAETTDRAGNGTYIDPDTGLLVTAAANIPRLERMVSGKVGILAEGASTNDALHARDLTNAAWVNTGCTAAKDATGLDGVANSASTLTATAGNATCLQTVTAASAQRTYSVDIKRKTGTGVVNITIDGGTTWVAVTLSSTVWTRFQVTQTVTNPQFGIQIVTSGDEVEVDFNQCEVLPFASSRIETTTTAVTRPADDIYISAASNSAKYRQPRTRILEFEYLGINTFDTILNGPTILDQFIFGGPSDRFRAQVSIDTNTYIDLSSPSADLAPNTVYRVGITFDGTTLKLWVNGTNTASSSTTGSTAITDLTKVQIMGSQQLARPTFGRTREYLEYDRAMSDAEMAIMTTLS